MLLYPMMVGPRILAKLLRFIFVSLAAATCETDVKLKKQWLVLHNS